VIQFAQRDSSPELFRPTLIYFQKYMQNLGIPFMNIQTYVSEDAMLNKSNSLIPNTIIQLIEQLNNALANDATDQATIGQLTGQLNTALANDATDQATITNLQGQVYNLQSRQVIAPTPVQPMPIQPMPARTIPARNVPARTVPARYQPSNQKYR
jgi:hypothetical protein